MPIEVRLAAEYSEWVLQQTLRYHKIVHNSDAPVPFAFMAHLYYGYRQGRVLMRQWAEVA